MVKSGTRRLLLNFGLFLFVASVVRELVPAQWISSLFGNQQVYAVPFAAIFGIPFFTSNSYSIPLIQSLVEMGMGRGPAMALIITGAGTSLPAMAGLLVVARWRIVALYVSMIFLGGILSGYLIDLLEFTGFGF